MASFDSQFESIQFPIHDEIFYTLILAPRMNTFSLNSEGSLNMTDVGGLYNLFQFIYCTLIPVENSLDFL